VLLEGDGVLRMQPVHREGRDPPRRRG
jgi:hypothetical protein